MPIPEVRIECTGLDCDRHAEIESVLRRVAVGDGEGRWHDPVDSIIVSRQLGGGRSGADVFEVVIRRGTRDGRRVAKIGPRDGMAREWDAYKKHLLTKPNALCAPIEAVTTGLLDAGTGDAEEREAVIYDHAAEFAGERSAPVTLEDVASDACSGRTESVEVAVKAVRDLLRKASTIIYADPQIAPGKTSLQALNPTLGPDLVVCVDRIGGHGRLQYREPLPEVLRKQRRYPRQVMEASLGHDPGEEAAIRPGSELRLLHLRSRRHGDVLLGEGDNITVEIRPATAGGMDQRLRDFAEHAELDLHGKVLETRAGQCRRRIEYFLPALEQLPRGISVDGTRTRDPFAALHQVITESAPGRVRSLVHGDLNPRNVLLVEGQPYLIDFAHMANDQPLLGDFAWLETCLLRHAIASNIDWPDLLYLQRLLATGSRVLALLARHRDAGDPVGDRLIELLEAERPNLVAPFRIIWAIRSQASEVYPPASGRPWWRDYLAMITWAAHRTLKWPDEDQSPAMVQAAVASAGVAAEWLVPANPYRNWPEKNLLAMARHVAPVLPATKPGTVEMVGEIMAEVDRRRADDANVKAVLEQVRIAIVREFFTADARATLVGLEQEHGVFVNISAYMGLEGQPEPDWGDTPKGESAASYWPTLLDSPAWAFGDHRWEPGQFPQLMSRSPQGGEALDLLAQQDEVVMLGDAGSGKTTIARELQYRLAALIAVDPDRRPRMPKGLVPRMPVVVRASDVARRLTQWDPEDPASTAGVVPAIAGIDTSAPFLAVGALHVTVDGFNELSSDEKQSVAKWIVAMRRSYPRTPMVACHRAFGYGSLLPFPILALQKVTIEQARGYLINWLRAQQVPDYHRRASELAGMLLDHPENEQIRDLAQTPLFLWMIAEHFAQTETLPTSLGQLFDEFSHLYLEERHHAGEETPTFEFTYEQKAPVLELIARTLVERGVTELAEGEVRAIIASIRQPRWRQLLHEIVGSEMLQREDSVLRFVHQSFQEYFGARVLAREATENKAEFRVRVLTFAWQESCRILLGFAGDQEELVAMVVETAINVDPLLAARLLRAAETPPSSAIARFLQIQETTLRDPAAGEYAVERAATALADYGSPAAREVLTGVAADPTSPTTARAAALAALLDMHRQVRFERVRPELRAAATRAVTTMLTPETPAELRELAARSAGEAELYSVGLSVAELIDEEQPWNVVRAAFGALAALDVALTPRVAARYRSAAERRLLRIEEIDLPAASTTALMQALQDERLELLEKLSDASPIGLLLKRRFCFEIASDLALLVDTAAAAERPVPNNGLAWEILTGDGEADDWLRAYAEGDDLVAAAAAHRLLRDAPDRAADLIARTSPADPRGKLLAAAEALRTAGPGDHLATVEHLIQELVPVADEDRIEPLAALASALAEVDEVRGIRSKTFATMALVEAGNPLAYVWPWFRAWLQGPVPADVTIDELLLGDEVSVEVAIFLAGAAQMPFLSEASEAYVVDLSEAARLRLLEASGDETNTRKAYRWSSAVAATNETRALPFIVRMASDPALATTIAKRSFRSTGFIEEPRIAAILRTVGYLGRKAHDDGDQNAASIAHQLLSSVNVVDAHPSVATARLLGLGYLGDWEPLLSALPPADDLAHLAAHNVVAIWTPGPYTPKLNEDPEAIARWIDRKLSATPDMDPSVRSTLQEIKHEIESKLARYVTSNHDAHSGTEMPSTRLLEP
jgi:hypothetical protein